jgi:YegS/Rv2252/BmrU family lipid kinase
LRRQALIIYNRYSGRSKSQHVLEKLILKLEEAGIDYDLLETKTDVEPSAYIRPKVNESTTDIIAIGGDGTLNHVLNGIKDSDVTLNIIPTGTGDDFVKNIDLGISSDEQIDTILHGKEIRVDVGICNEQLFLNGVGLGFDGQIVSDMLNKESWLSGHAKYYYYVLRILAIFKSVSLNLIIDSKKLNKDLILLTVANGTTFGGGFRLAPDADISDGLLDICIIGDIPPLKRFLNIHKLSTGSHGKLKEVELNKAKSVTIEENPLIIGHIDGEYLGHPPFHIISLPSYLKIRVRSEP